MDGTQQFATTALGCRTPMDGTQLLAAIIICRCPIVAGPSALAMPRWAAVFETNVAIDCQLQLHPWAFPGPHHARDCIARFSGGRF